MAETVNKTTNYIEKVTAFTGPEINKLVKNAEFLKLLDREEVAAWLAFIDVKEKFLGNERAPNYQDLVERMLMCYKDIGCRCTYKLHLLHAHLDRFPPNCGAQGEQQCERAHQDIMHQELNYKSSMNGPRFVSNVIYQQNGNGTVFPRKTNLKSFADNVKMLV